MKSNSWKGFAEMIGIVAIVASLILVAYELRQNSQYTLVQEQMEARNGIEFRPESP